MDYDKFLNYAFPAFGIALLGAAICIGLALLVIKFVGDEPGKIASKVSGVAVIGFVAIAFILAGTAILIGWFLPWGSPF